MNKNKHEEDGNLLTAFPVSEIISQKVHKFANYSGQKRKQRS